MLAAMSKSRPANVTAGSGLLDVVVVAALAGLIINDHVLKAASAGTAWRVVTGKLSDVCGVLFLPVLVVAGTELASAWRRRSAWRGPSVRVAVVVAAVVAVCFALMKTTALGGAVYAWSLGTLQWPVRALAALLSSSSVPALRPVRHVVDPGDLIAVPFAFYVVAQARVRAASWAISGATKV
ncbi:MAG TPA: hypothetical protein VGF99_08970 [Myxococcota bacterium]